MIYNVLPLQDDLDLLAKQVGHTVSDHRNYGGVVVAKPWGYEYLCFDNGYCAVWILHIARKRKTSLHCHPSKDTTLISLFSTLRCSGLKFDYSLKPMDVVTLAKGVFHQTESSSESLISPPCEDGSWMVEIEYPSNKSDLVRAKDPYGREGKEYEGIANEVPYSHNWLKFNGKPQTLTYLGCKFIISETGTHPLGNGLFLSIAKETNNMKLSHYVADFIADLGITHVFGVVGGGVMHLSDSFGYNERIKYVACHHEQAAAMAAESYARLNGIACCLVTTGPGGTNALTGVACAWIDSIPVVFISGQVTSDTLSEGTGLRQYGIQETNIVELVRPITKCAGVVWHEDMVRILLEKAVYLATHGRPGPVWIDIPLDIQSKRIDPTHLKGFEAPILAPPTLTNVVEQTLSMLRESKRPVMIVGNGVRLAGAVTQVRELIDALGIPVVTSWTAADIVADHPLHIGHAGIFGDRASNFAVQNSDLLLILGSRMSIPQTGYNTKTFAREAKIIMVDVDANEMKKPSLKVDLAIRADVKEFIGAMLNGPSFKPSELWMAEDGRIGGRLVPIPSHAEWLQRCLDWRERYPVCLPEYADQVGSVNSFYFIDRLSAVAPSDTVVVLDEGTAFTCTMQAWKHKFGQRVYTCSGHAAMGYGLPGAIGAAFATGRKVICISGDGGLQFNLQELATIAHHNLPITIFVLNNNGYLTMRHTQANHFGREIGIGPKSGLGFPDLRKIAAAYDIVYFNANEYDAQQFINGSLRFLTSARQNYPMICEIIMDENQQLIPRVSSMKRPDGSIISKPLEDLFPFLPRNEFNAQMIIPTVEVLA